MKNKKPEYVMDYEEMREAVLAGGAYATDAARNGLTYLGLADSPPSTIGVYNWNTTYVGPFSPTTQDEEAMWAVGPDQPPIP